MEKDESFGRVRDFVLPLENNEELGWEKKFLFINFHIKSRSIKMRNDIFLRIFFYIQYLHKGICVIFHILFLMKKAKNTYK
jgi:hypothetical protein